MLYKCILNFLNNITMNKIDLLYDKYKDTVSLKKITINQLNLFRNILEKENIKEITKKKLLDDVENFSSKEFSYLIKRYNWRKSSFKFKLDNFMIKTYDKVVISTSEYEIGYQNNPVGISGLIFYLKYYDFMMIDYDSLSYKEIIEKLKPTSHFFNYAIYQTDNGYHVYVISHLLSHRTKLNMYLMRDLGCDLNYIYFSYRNGYKIRLSAKKNHQKHINQEFIGYFGNNVIHPKCQIYLHLLNQVSKCFIP